jgi:hypothetical protein
MYADEIKARATGKFAMTSLLQLYARTGRRDEQRPAGAVGVTC